MERYTIKNEPGQAQTVNHGVRYRKMITSLFVRRIEEMDLEGMQFPQDGFTCHTTRETIELLHQSCPGRVILRFGDQNWPPRSCDLSPLDFFLWGFLKSMVYANKPTTTQALKRKLDAVLMKYRSIYAKRSLKISLKDRVCFSKPAAAICPMYCSIDNLILSTLRYYKAFTIFF